MFGPDGWRVADICSEQRRLVYLCSALGTAGLCNVRREVHWMFIILTDGLVLNFDNEWILAKFCPTCINDCVPLDFWCIFEQPWILGF